MAICNVVADDLDSVQSLFHQEVVGNVNRLTDCLEEMLDRLENGDREKRGQNKRDFWEHTTGVFNIVLGGLQTFLTGLHLEYSRLEFEGNDLEHCRQILETERDDLIEKSHDLHCRIQYNTLEIKLEQTFIDTEKCNSVNSAECFKEEADENLRRTKEIIRMANLRNCQVDRELFNQMEDMMNQFKSYQSERENYVKEIDLFDGIRGRKISNWLNEPRSDEEREKGEHIIAVLELSARKRRLQPKLISNALRMYSFNESLTFDRLDNIKRLEEMTSLQAKVDAMSGVNNILPRSAFAVTDLMVQIEGSQSDHESPNDDDAYSDFVESQGQHLDSGHGLHRCPRKVNLATDPITDPDLKEQLESALRWETNDGDMSSAATDLTRDSSMASTMHDLTLTPRRLSDRSVHEDEESTTSLCGDALSPEKPHDATDAVKSNPIIQARGAIFSQHQIESATALHISSDKLSLMTGLARRRSPGGPSSMTAIDSNKENKGTSPQRVAADDRETRSLGWESSGRAGSSGSASNSGNPRSSRDHFLPGSGKSRGD